MIKREQSRSSSQSLKYNNSVKNVLRILLILQLLFACCNGIEDESIFENKKSLCSWTPRLTLLSPSHGALSKDNIEYNETKGEIIVPDKRNITLQCISRKPIDFDFRGLLSHHLTEVETSRILPASESNNELSYECFKIIVKLETDRSATGRYNCWNINDDKTANSSLYVFANGGTSPYLLFADIGEEMLIKATNPESAILPCVTTNPKASVVLYRVKRETFELQTVGEHLAFDHKVGFKLDLRKFPDPYDKFKCIAKGKKSVQDEIVFKLEEYDDWSKSKAQVHKAKIFYNAITQRKGKQSTFVCTGDNGLEMSSSSNCRTGIECRLAEKCLTKEATCITSPRKANRCSPSLKKDLFSENVFLGEVCESMGRNANGGVFHCSSSKYVEDSTLTYFIGLKNTIIKDWREVPTKDILSVAALLGNDVTYNVGESISFSCEGSRFVFSKGFQWKIILKDGSMISANASKISNRTSDSLIKEEVLIKISQPEILQIVCLGPVWNENTWVNSSLPLKIQDTVAPFFLEPENITLFFYPGDSNKTVVCTAKGFPQPDILWKKNDEEQRSDMMFENTTPNITTATLILPQITTSDHGTIYLCNASNPRGMVFKTFSIHVRAQLWPIVFSIVGAILFVCFAMALIGSFLAMKRIKKKSPGGYTIHFSEFDVEEFKKGNPDAVQHCADAVQKAFYLPYDEKKYEISEQDLLLDYENILGQGEFGVVIKGHLQLDENESFPVAVKTLKGPDINHLKALLSELKIRIYIGHHKNIVKLVGAITTTLPNKRAFVVLEYCALGNVENYLRNHRATFLDEFESGQMLVGGGGVVSSSYVRIQYLLRTSDLIKWAYEIATAMEYLASKKIIHGDLALRNILLNANQNVKITDFGLSKQLYKYTNNYVTNRKDVPLPWRWLAPEALQDYNFSTQTDIWAYGICLWELFSLAEVPYAGVMLDTEFLRQLGNGYRLDRPRYCNMEIYSLMRDCWRQEAENRPNFTTLRQEFAQKLSPECIVDSDSDSDVVAQNVTNHLQEVLLPPNYRDREVLSLRV